MYFNFFLLVLLTHNLKNIKLCFKADSNIFINGEVQFKIVFLSKMISIGASILELLILSNFEVS
jgi:hypothetical protein